MHFHLHITVAPHRSWTHADLAEALACDVARYNFRPLVITNHFRDGRRPYKELIPTRVVDVACESDASREIFKMGTLLNNSGWRVKRLKIEGDPRHPAIANRAIYFETHLKNWSLETVDHPSIGPLPRSTTAKGNVFHTMRRANYAHIQTALLGLPDYELEAAVLDTAPQLDHEWINQ